MRWNFLKNRVILTLVLSLLILGCLILFSPVFSVLNKNIQNNYYILKNEITQAQASNNIIIATIDKHSLDALGRFPFHRSVYADFLKNIESAWAATVGFDIIFSDTSVPEQDDIFARALNESKIPVVFGTPIDSQNNVEKPLPLFEREIFDQGFLPPNVQKSNKTVYSFSPFLRLANGDYEHFWLAVLRWFYSYLYDDDLRQQHFWYTPEWNYRFSDALAIPPSSKGNNDVLISFFPENKFQQISFSDLVDEQSIKKHNLQDAIILVWTTVDGIKDEFFTPFGREYGVFVHGNIINTILTQKFLVYFNKNLEWLLLFLLVITSVYFNLSRSRSTLLISNFVLFSVFVIMFPIGVFLFTNLIMNYLVEIIFAIILSLALSTTVKYLIEDKNKQKLRQSLSEYVGSDIADEVLEGEGKINFDGEEKTAILFFSDIEWFTTISEHLTPRKLVKFLREYLSEMSNIILDKKWYINKYEWDAIMALWWIFHDIEPLNYTQVCEASLMQLEWLTNRNKDWKDIYNEQISIRIGIHSGEVIVWNIWAKGRKMEFTALWDTVNTASRLEWVNKLYGTHICVSESIFSQTKDDFVYRYLDKIRVKWRKKLLHIYELVGRAWEVSDAKQTLFEKYQHALDTYFSRDFAQAKMLFQELVDLWDAPSLAFKSRCSMYILNPPESDWDGVWQMETK